jgi:hypothetical protein
MDPGRPGPTCQMYYLPGEPAMNSRPYVRNGVLGLVVLVTAAACGAGAKDGGADNGKAQVAAGPSCTSRDTTPVSLAVLDYIKSASPTPQRYLSAYGSDSAVPDDGFKVLQDKGPTYFYNSDPKAQQQLKDKLASVGPYATLLVVYRGKDEANNGNLVTVKLGGHYVGGEHDGKPAQEKQIAVRCDSTGWRLTAPSPVPGAPAAGKPAAAAAAGTPAAEKSGAAPAK